MEINESKFKGTDEDLVDIEMKTFRWYPRIRVRCIEFLIIERFIILECHLSTKLNFVVFYTPFM